MKLPHPARRLAACLAAAAVIAFAAAANQASPPTREEYDRLNARVDRIDDRQYNFLLLAAAGGLAGGAIGGYASKSRRHNHAPSHEEQPTH